MMRMGIDFCVLEIRTVRDSYPLPKVEDLIDRLASVQYFSKLDLCSGYH